MFRSIIDNLLVGVVGSLIATIVVFLVTQLREHFRHQKRIKSANLFVIDSLRAYIVNADIPSDEILNALRKSAARKFNLKEYELWPVSTYVEETVAEIIGNVYLKIEEQTSYLEKANKYLVQHKIEAENNPNRIDKEDRQRNLICLIILYISFYSFYILTKILSSLVFSFLNRFDFQFYPGDYQNYRMFSFIIAITVVAIFFLILWILFFQKLKRKIISILQQGQ